MRTTIDCNSYDEAIARLKARWGTLFMAPSVTDDQRRFFGNERVEITSPSGYVRRGVITITTGYQPSLMLKHRKSDSGSWDLINSADVITAVICGGKRIPRRVAPRRRT